MLSKAHQNLDPFPRSAMRDQIELDQKYMKRALELASKAEGLTNPNPCVGCVIVNNDGVIIGEGWHVKAGQPHAEVVALKDIGDKAQNCTAYVSLEPCNHYGRTPPCTLALIRHGIRRVVIGMVDPDARVSGTGILHLRDNGIDVSVGICSEECKNINAPFVHRVITKRPFSIVWNTCKILNFDESKGDESNMHTIELSKPNLRDLFNINDLTKQIDSLIITKSQLFDIDHKHFDSLPQHITVVIIDEVSISDNVLEIIGKTSVHRKWTFITDSTKDNRQVVQGSKEDLVSIVRIENLHQKDNTEEILHKLAGGGSNCVLLLTVSSIGQLMKYNQLQLVQKLIVSFDNGDSDNELNIKKTMAYVEGNLDNIKERVSHKTNSFTTFGLKLWEQKT